MAVNGLGGRVTSMSLNGRTGIYATFSIYSSTQGRSTKRRCRRKVTPIRSVLRVFQVRLPRPRITSIVYLFCLGGCLFTKGVYRTSFQLFLSWCRLCVVLGTVEGGILNNRGVAMRRTH